ncbi:MAG: hypothetical protein KatS3mg011_0406 [Acidimicrobiia bacterium]|nr:MAG: hypothetical protein KatS3mg011_0406 [Acidimicrobiia bacterium]
MPAGGGFVVSRTAAVSVGVGLLVAVLTSVGIAVRATHGARTSGDEPQYLLTALSLWEDGNLDISDERDSGRYVPFHEVPLYPQTRLLPDGRRISPHDPLLPLLLAIPMDVGGWVAAKAVLAGFAGLLAGTLVWVAVERLGVRRSVAALIVTVFGCSPPLAVYATQVYPEIVAAVGVAAALAWLLGPLSNRDAWLVTAVVVGLAWLGVKYLPVAAVLTVPLLLRAQNRGRLAAALGAAGILYLVGHIWLYGGLTAYATGDHFVGGELTVVGTRPDWWGRSSRLLGLLVDRGFGLAPWQPAYLLLPVAVVWGWRRGWRLLVGVLGVGWLVATFVALTMHGWWFPGRQLVSVLPAGVLLVAGWADQAAHRLWAALVLGAAGILAFGFLAVEGLSGEITWIVDFGATADPVYRGLAAVMPDYQNPTDLTWTLHGVWLAVVTILGWLGWRGTAVRPLFLRPRGGIG